MDTRYFYPKDDAATKEVGTVLAALVQPGDLITLSGPLGAGKTTLAQGLARALGVKEPVTSPTYVLLNEYEGQWPLLHLDAYRLDAAEEETLRDAGIDEMLLRPDAVKLVEWPERILPWLGHARFVLTIAPTEDGGRSITLREMSGTI